MQQLLKNKRKYLFYLTIIWLFSIFLVNPIGEFPLNDDWSYSHNAKTLTLENEIVFHEWGAMTLIVHTFWGALFCKIFGFSFTALRVSTLVLGLGTLFMSFFFFQEGGLKKKYAFWATLLIGFNFYFFANAFTYMTEVPFLFFFMSAAFFFLKSINGKSDKNIIYATLFSILAILIRQPGILIPLAFFFVFTLKNKFSLKNLILAILPSILTFLSFILFVNWRETTYGLSPNFGKTSQLFDNILNGKLMFALETQSIGFFVYWGLFLIPLLIFLLPYFWKKITHLEKIFSVVITLLFFHPFIRLPFKTFMGNSFLNIGIGPKVIPSDSIISPPRIGKNDWENLYLIAFIASMFLIKWVFIKVYHLFFLIKNKKSAHVNWGTLFALTASFGYFLFLMLNNHHIDRYNLIAIPFLILLLAPLELDFKMPRWNLILSGIAFIIIAGFSISATHDYLSWNRARWSAINYGLDDLQIPRDHLNGGFEYKGWYDIPYFVAADWEDFEEWNTHQEQYKIAFSEQCKYRTLKTIPYQRYLPPRVDSMYLLQKEKITQFDTLYCTAENLSADGKHFLSNQEDVFLESGEHQVSDNFHKGNHSIFLENNQQYGFPVILKNIEPCEKILVTYWTFPMHDTPRGIIENKNYSQFPSQFRITTIENNGWGKSIQEFRVPPDFNQTEIRFHLWNSIGEGIWFDDLMIIRMK